MSDEQTHSATDQAIRSRISAIFPSEAVREKVMKIITEDDTKRPDGWAHDSCAPYYKEYFGKQMQVMADDQLVTCREIIYDFKSFCRPGNPAGCSERTLYNRVNQSRRYLYEQMNTEDGKYSTWRDITKVDTLPGIGIVISIHSEIRMAMLGDKNIPMPRMAESTMDKPKWKQKLDDWVESETTEPIVIRNLILDEREQETIRNELMGDRRIESIVTCSEIRAMKINPDVV